MLKGALVALAAVFALALPARAASSRDVSSVSVVPHSPSAFAQEVATVETRPSPVGIIARDAIGGAILGAAVGGGVVLYRRYVENGSNGQWGDWKRDIGIGAGIGLAVGLIFGAVDAASNADRVFNGPIADERPTGYAPAVATYGMKF